MIFTGYKFVEGDFITFKTLFLAEKLNQIKLESIDFCAEIFLTNHFRTGF